MIKFKKREQQRSIELDRNIYKNFLSVRFNHR